jgi:uncharacterized membrane protein
MSWLSRYRLRFYLRNSIWIWPAVGIVVALIFVPLLTAFEQAMDWHMSISADTARVVLGTVAASTFTLVVLVSSAVLLAVQLAAAQLTPRLITMVYRDRYRKFALTLFVFTFAFSVAVLVRIEDRMPLLSGYIAGWGFLMNIAVFLLFIDGLGKTLRPSAAVRVVGLLARDVIESVYPTSFKEDFVPPEPFEINGNQPRRIVPNVVDGTVLTFYRQGLVTLGERSNCLIELVPEVGDFVADGDPLFRIYEGGDELADRDLQNLVAIDQERTLEQDPLFAFRIIVDIASKALSPAINDPTTAVLAIDQIHHLLRDVGKRYLAEGEERGKGGQIRLIYRTPNWEDFVLLGVTEIRHYGRDSIQVQRRLRAMLEDLIATLPKRRHPVLLKELNLLATSSKRAFPDLDDQALADSGDLQGIGGSYDEMYEHTHEARLRAAN